jgi:TolA-binding protein
MSIGKFAKNLIMTTTLSNTEILKKVQEAFPAAKTSMACIAWYKSDLRKKNILNDKKVVEKTLEEQLFELVTQIEELELKKLELQDAIVAKRDEILATQEQEEPVEA